MLMPGQGSLACLSPAVAWRPRDCSAWKNFPKCKLIGHPRFFLPGLAPVASECCDAGEFPVEQAAQCHGHEKQAGLLSGLECWPGHIAACSVGITSSLPGASSWLSSGRIEYAVRPL